MERRQSITQFIGRIFANQQCQVHKMLQSGQYKTYTYLHFTKYTHSKMMHVMLRRQRDRLRSSDTLFNPQTQCEVVIDQKETAEPQTHLLLKTNFKTPSNIFKLLQLQTTILSKRLDLPQKAKLIDRALRTLILSLMTNTNYQLYTWRDISIVVDQKEEIIIQIDKSATSGMGLLLYGDSLSFDEFSRVYEIVSLEDMKQCCPVMNLSYQMKVRAIAKILLTLIIHRYFQVLREVPDYKAKGGQKQLLTKAECLAMLSKRKDFYKTILQNKAMIAKIESLQKQNNVNYLKFLREVFIEERELKWSEVIDYIIAKQTELPSYTLKSKQNSLSQIVDQMKSELVDKRGDQYIEIFQSLGLYNDLNALLLALMHLQTSSAEQAMSYSDINLLLYASNSSDYMTKDELFRFFLRLKTKIFDLKINIDDKDILNQQELPEQTKKADKTTHQQQAKCLSTAQTPVINYYPFNQAILNSPIRSLALQKSPVTSGQFNQAKIDGPIRPPILVQSSLVPRQALLIQDDNQQPQQIGEYLSTLSSNFGRFSYKYRKSNFVTQNYYNKSFQRYQNMFK